MAESSKVLTREGSLFNEKIVKIGEELNEYVTIGADPVSFKPIVRICNTDGTTTTHVSLNAEHFIDLTYNLQQKLDGRGWVHDTLTETGITVESISDDICRLKSARGEKVAISCDAADQIAYKKVIEIYEITRGYIDEYRHIKPILEKYQKVVYVNHFDEIFNQVKCCPKTSKYLDLKSV